MEFEYHYNGIALIIVSDPNKALEIGEWSICGGDRLERIYLSRFDSANLPYCGT